MKEVERRLDNIKETLEGEEWRKEEEQLEMRRKEEGTATGIMLKKDELDEDIPVRELDQEEVAEIFQQR